MVLNLLRVEGVNPEFMLERSFYQFQNFDAIPELQRRLWTVQLRVAFLQRRLPFQK